MRRIQIPSIVSVITVFVLVGKMLTKADHRNIVTAGGCSQTNYEFLGHEIRSYIEATKPIATHRQVSFCGWFTDFWDARIKDNEKITVVDYENNQHSHAFAVLYSEDRMYVIVNNHGTYYNRSTPASGSSFYLCVTIDAASTGRSMVYVNGEEWESFLGREGEIKGGGTLRIGQGARAFSRFSYEGDVNNFMVWDRILEFTEIQAMYSSDSHSAPGCTFAPTAENVKLFGAVKRDPKIPACPKTAYMFSNYETKSYIEVTSPISSLSEFSFCGWFAPFWQDGMSDEDKIYLVSYKNDDNLYAFSLYYTKQHDYIWINNQGTYLPRSTPRSGTTYHLCVTTDAKKAGQSELYINGELSKYFNGKAGEIRGGGKMRIGQNVPSFSAYSYQGNVTNFMMWDRILNDVEVTDMFLTHSYFPKECIFAPTEDKVELHGAVSPIDG